MIDIKVEESEEEEEVEDPVVERSPEQERPPSITVPAGMPVIKMLDVSKVRLRSRDPPQKKSPTDDTKEEQEPAKPAWMNDLKSVGDRRSVGIFLERQELSHIRYVCMQLSMSMSGRNASVEKLFSKSRAFRQKEAVVTSPPPVLDIKSQSLRGRSPLRSDKSTKVNDELNSLLNKSNKFTKVSSEASSDDVSFERKVFFDLM